VPFAANPVEMTPEEFRLLAELIHTYSGLLFREEMKYLLERRLSPRLAELELADFGAYYRYLRYDAAAKSELALATELLLIHESYFFREPEQLRSFAKELLPLLCAEHAGSRRLRIWSAGCATGEEPYTLAMLLLDSGLCEGWDANVYGSDLSRRALAQARRGIYGENAMRAIPAEALARHFETVGPGQFRVREEVRKRVTFGQVNLLDAQNLGLVGRMDAVFCRNVMIYFDLPARRRVLQHLYDKLVEGGYLLLGHSENLINVTADFELVHLRDDLVYRRPRS
jgi:chemotaxis protein methyltransferase CheR